MSYLEKLKILLNQIKDSKHNLWNRSEIKNNEREKISFEFDLEVYKIELLIIQEENKCR